MTPEASEHLDKAREALSKARGPQAVVTASEAQEAIAAAGQFVDCITSLLS